MTCIGTSIVDKSNPTGGIELTTPGLSIQLATTEPLQFDIQMSDFFNNILHFTA